jgi:soluble lytic murein transglycosylase
MRRIRLPRKNELPIFLAGALLVLLVWGVLTWLNHSRLPLKPQAQTITSPWIPATVKHWETQIDQNAAKYKIDPNLVAIVMNLESGGSASASSDAGAKGLMQITVPTSKDIASKYLKQPVDYYNLEDPNTNIEFGTAYLAELRKVYGTWDQAPTWNETVELVAAAYNGGFGAANAIIKGEGLTDTQTVVYSRDAFNMWRERFSGTSPTYDRWLERGGQKLVDQAKAEQ